MKIIQNLALCKSEQIRRYESYYPSLQTLQFPKDTVDKYFNRLCQLLQEKLYALRNRLESDAENNKKTKTFIRFLFSPHVIYLGFYFNCGQLYNNTTKTEELCQLPATFIMSKNRWQCGKHFKVVHLFHQCLHHPQDPRFYAAQIHNTVNRHKQLPKLQKEVHSK
ncbi:hypothetical protein RhiirA4_490281 [Rhizophagus irregularis]|uniref:Uncharacterized protein n=1 Tax=Rhizophagus irregularis TaxID=588596 RepID=A0A2I1HVM1_9GLOM|nr:hypothetical protein RhiirA4_490281 [Rhizophagus irregularis]